MSKMDKKTLKPRIRFANFTDAWEQRKYEDIGTPSSGGTLGYDDLAVNGEYNCVLYGELYTHHDCLIKEIQNKTNCQGNTVQRNDVLFPQSTTVDALSLISPACLNVDTAETSGVFVIRPHKDIDGNFVAYYTKGNNYQRKKLSKKAQGLTIVHLYYQSIKDETIAVPTFTEQKRISTFFENLDNLITLHQRKLDKLSNVKKSLLEKMFPQKNSTTPKIRFKGFTDAWEQRKLGDILEISTFRNGDSYGKDDVLSVSDEYGCVNQIRFQGRSFAGADISNYKIVNTGDIVYTRSPLQAKPFGIIKVVRDETGIVSPLYMVNKAKEGNDAEFIYRIFDLPYKTNNYLSPLVRKGAKNTMNVSETEWLSGDVVVARSYEEQKSIGKYFKAFDDLITLHQRKLEKLKNVKKALLEKMFV